MTMRVYKLYTTTVANAAANIRLPRRGVITSIKWVARVGVVADTNLVLAELSFASVGQLTTNDSIGSIDECEVFVKQSAVGHLTTHANVQTVGLAVPFEAGAFLYLNTASSSATIKVTCFVYVME